MNELVRFVFGRAVKTETGPLKPFWSTVRLKNKEEEDRLSLVHKDLIKYLSPKPIGPVYFIGYGRRPEGETDRWYIPRRKTILEMTKMEIESIEPTYIEFDFKFDSSDGEGKAKSETA